MFPLNTLDYFRADYRWEAGDAQVEVRIFLTTDESAVLQGFTQSRDLCPGRTIRFAIFEETVLLVTPLVQSDRWLIFQFPDVDAPLCDFIGEFIQLFQFFERVRGDWEDRGIPPFPGVIGTLEN